MTSRELTLVLVGLKKLATVEREQGGIAAPSEHAEMEMVRQIGQLAANELALAHMEEHHRHARPPFPHTAPGGQSH